MVSSSRNHTVATKINDDELSGLIRMVADRESAGDRRATKSSVAADLIHAGLVAKGYLTDTPDECPHPKDRVEKHGWGNTCGVCGQRVTT